MTDDKELPIKARASLDALRTQSEDSELKLRSTRWRELSERLDLSGRELFDVLSAPDESRYVHSGTVGRVRKSTGSLEGRVFSSKLLRRWVGYGAIASFIVFVGIKTLTSSSGTPEKVEFATYTTAPGQSTKLQLPDGSKVTLAPSSKLRYEKSFGKVTRKIELDGLAVFTVINEGQPPFIVGIGGAEARVLGTTFSVRKYISDNATKVVVVEGKVEVGSKAVANRLVLTAGEAIDITDKGSVSIDRDANVASELGWVSGKLSFRSAPLSDVITEVNRMYGTDIRLEKASLGARPVTVSIDASLSPRGIASLLAGISGTRAQWQGSVVLFKE